MTLHIIDPQKIPSPVARAFLASDEADTILKEIREYCGLAESADNFLRALVIDYLAGIIDAEHMTKIIEEQLGIVDINQSVFILSRLFEGIITVCGAETPVALQIPIDYEFVKQIVRDYPLTNRVYQGVFGDIVEDNDAALTTAPVAPLTLLPDTSRNANDDLENSSYEGIEEVPIIDPSHELAAPIALSSIQFAPKTDNLPPQELTQPVVPTEVHETEKEVHEMMVGPIAEVEAHQHIADSVAKVPVLDYQNRAAQVIAKIPNFLNEDTSTQLKLRDMIEKRIRGMIEPYDFRARVYALREQKILSVDQIESIVNNTELAFLAVHTSQNVVLSSGTIPEYSLEQSIADKKKHQEKIISAETILEDTTSVSNSQVTRVMTEESSHSSSINEDKNMSEHDDPSQVFVEHITSQTPITVIPAVMPTPPQDVSQNPSPVPSLSNQPIWTLRKGRDVHPPRPGLIGPIEEIRTMTLVQWRRLGRTPEECAERIKQKIQLLANETYDMRVDGLKAWRQTEMYKQYTEISSEIMHGQKSLPDAIDSWKARTNATHVLTPEEWNTILKLNGQLRFA